MCRLLSDHIKSVIFHTKNKPRIRPVTCNRASSRQGSCLQKDSGVAAHDHNHLLNPRTQGSKYMPGNSCPEALRTHISRCLGPQTILIVHVLFVYVEP